MRSTPTAIFGSTRPAKTWVRAKFLSGELAFRGHARTAHLADPPKNRGVAGPADIKAP